MHTPGPWNVSGLLAIPSEEALRKERMSEGVNADGPRAIAQVYISTDERDGFERRHQEARDNARLIAQAPAMFEALEAMVMVAEFDGKGQRAAYQKARAAIAAARGTA